MSRSKDILTSWDKNAGRWIQAVREGAIPSRKAGTDQAIMDAIGRRAPARLLDIGCGEGWLLRRACAAYGCAGTGVDASAELIRAARAADPGNSYEVATYADLIAGRDGLGGGFDAIVCNYALFEEDTAGLLAALRGRLSQGGAILIQTLHPDSIEADGNPTDAWRVEDFSAFDSADWAPMPWYFRTLASWREAVEAAGLRVVETFEPRAGKEQAPLSLLLVCQPS